MTAVSRCPDAGHPRPCRSIFRELRIVETRPASSLRRSILLVFLNGPICGVRGDRVSVFFFARTRHKLRLVSATPAEATALKTDAPRLRNSIPARALAPAGRHFALFLGRRSDAIFV